MQVITSMCLEETSTSGHVLLLTAFMLFSSFYGIFGHGVWTDIRLVILKTLGRTILIINYTDQLTIHMKYLIQLDMYDKSNVYIYVFQSSHNMDWKYLHIYRYTTTTT